MHLNFAPPDDTPDDLIEAVGAEEARAMFWEFREGRRLALHLALARQRKLAAQNYHAEHVGVDGLGQCHVRVDSNLYLHLCAMFGKEEVDSPGFWNRFDADNPDLLVKPTYRAKPIFQQRVTLADNLEAAA